MADKGSAKREIYLGIANSALEPFLAQRNKIVDAFTAGIDLGLKPWCKSIADLQRDGMPQILVDNLPSRVMRAGPHFMHVDMSATGDRCGIAFARLDGSSFVQKDGAQMSVPVFSVPLAVAIQPSKLCPWLACSRSSRRA